VREISATRDVLTAAVEGDIEAIENVLRITRIRVRYRLTIPPDKRESAERAVANHPAACPAWNTVRHCIDISIQADINEEL
jgi:uncharacterized OsmC-like protein